MAQSDATPAASSAADPAGPAAIAVSRLVKQYKTVRAVDDVSFAIARGSITGLLGGNGAGKTTTIAMIMGLVLPTSGTVEVLGHPMPAESADVLGRMNFESPYVDMPMRLTVRQNLTVFGRLYAVEHLKDRIAQLADDLDLKDFLDRPNGKLSAGQKTRVALAKALINAPELLLLDEPTASLDPDTADWVREHLETYRGRAGRPSCSPRTTCSRSSVCAIASSSSSAGGSRRTTVRTASWRATAARRWSRCSSTSRAAAARAAMMRVHRRR